MGAKNGFYDVVATADKSEEQLWNLEHCENILLSGNVIDNFQNFRCLSTSVSCSSLEDLEENLMSLEAAEELREWTELWHNLTQNWPKKKSGCTSPIIFACHFLIRFSKPALKQIPLQNGLSTKKS